MRRKRAESIILLAPAVGLQCRLVHIPFAIYSLLVGLAVGSFLNVVIHRVPRGESVVRPRSRCPGCGQAIRAFDNIPVLSYLLLGGRCRSCKARISPRYPLLELLTGALFLACYVRWGVSLSTLGAALFCALMIALAAIDIEHFLLPDRLTLPGIVLGLALSSWLEWTTLPASVLGAGLGAGVLLALFYVWLWVRKEEGMGLGDVKMIALIGAFLGWKGMLLCLFLSSLLGAVVGLGLMLVQGRDLKTKLPFGTFLAAGALVTLFFGPPILARYLALFPH